MQNLVQQGAAVGRIGQVQGIINFTGLQIRYVKVPNITPGCCAIKLDSKGSRIYIFNRSKYFWPK